MARIQARVKRAKQKAAAESSEEVSSNGFYDIKSLGGSLKLTSQENVELTTDLAHELLAMPAFHSERPLRKTHVKTLLRHMRRGTFHWNLVTLITCRCREAHGEHAAGTTFRMNGQHTCHSRLLAASLRAPVKLVRYSAETEADMRRLYSTIDRGAARTKANVIDSYVGGTKDFTDCPGHVRAQLAPAMNMWKWSTIHERQEHDAEDIAYLLLEGEKVVTQHVIKFLTRFGTDEIRHVRRAPVVAAMLETFSKQPAESPEFWEPVVSGLNLKSAGDPRKRLHKMLLTSNVKGGCGTTIARMAKNSLISQESMYRLCITCWNAWREGREIQTLRVSSERMEAV
jgi:hypothetical protein